MDHLHRSQYDTPVQHLRRRLDQAKADAAETQYILPELRTWQQAARNRIRNNGHRYRQFEHWTWTRNPDTHRAERWIGFQIKTERDKRNRTTSARNWPPYIVDITYADEHTHTNHTGWYADSFQYRTYRGCAVYIRGAGWLPGYLDAESEVIQCDLSAVGSYPTPPDHPDNPYSSRDDRREAAYQGDELARIDAERDREADELHNAARIIAEELDDTESERDKALETAIALVPARNTGEPCTRRAIRATLTQAIRTYRNACEQIDELREKFEEAAADYARATGDTFEY